MNNHKDFNNLQNLNSPKGGGLAFTIYIIAFVFVSFFGQTIVGAIFGAKSASYTFICACLPALTFLLIILFFKAQTKQSLFNMVGVSKFKWSYALLALVISASMLFGLGFVNDAFVCILNKWGANISGVKVPLDNFGQLVVCVLTYALLPAVFEEVFFRGLLLNCLKGVKPLFVILSAGLCFAIYHCSLAQLLYQFVYGVALTSIALACGSVIPCIIAHFLNNFIVIILEYYKVPLNLYNPLCIIFGVLGLITAFTFTFFAIKKKNIKKTDNVGIFFVFASAGIFVCVLLTLGTLLASITGGKI